MRDKATVVGRMSEDAGVRGDTLMTPDHSAFQVRSSVYGRTGIGRSRKILISGRHEKAPTR